MAKGIKTGGRVAGVPNKATREFRQTVQALLDENRSNVGLWLTAVATGNGDPDKADPAKALDLIAKLAEYAAPKLNRTEHTGAGGGPVQVMGVELHFVGASVPDAAG